MRTKVILFDVDGVLIRPPHYFTKELENRGYPSAAEKIFPFYEEGEHDKCLEGKESIETAIYPFLKNIGWKEDVHEYFRQQFCFEAQFLDKDFLRDIQTLREKGVFCYLATDQEKKRAHFLLQDLDLSSRFDGHFISCFLGKRKCHKGFWEDVFQDLEHFFPSINPNEIAFFDDMQNNVDRALSFGVRAFLFTDIKQYKKDLDIF